MVLKSRSSLESPQRAAGGQRISVLSHCGVTWCPISQYSLQINTDVGVYLISIRAEFGAGLCAPAGRSGHVAAYLNLLAGAMSVMSSLQCDEVAIRSSPPPAFRGLVLR